MTGERIEPQEPTPDRPPGLPERLRLPYLLKRYPARGVRALFVLVNGFLTIGLLTTIAMLSGTPFVFPSLGPTAILLFFNPNHPTASPRNTLFGHAIGILCGYASLWLLGLTDHSSALEEGVHIQRVFCAALSLATTGSLTVLFNVSHPPAGATTLIIALGIITQPYHLLIIEVSVAILVLQAIVINRLAGIEYPGRAPRPDPTGGGPTSQPGV